jgi:hypothetical protein
MNDLIADVHAVIFVDYIQLIDVDMKQSVSTLFGFLSGEFCGALGAERGGREQAGCGVEARSNDLGGFARQQLDSLRIPRLKTSQDGVSDSL